MKTFLVVLVALSVSAAATAQVSQPPDSGNADKFLDELASKVSLYRQASYHEKLFLHLDRSEYKPGQAIWFKVYVVESVLHRPSTASNMLIAQLIADNGQSVAFAASRISNGISRGTLTVPTEINEGIYTMIAYTDWMRNGHPEDIFSQKITIAKSLVPELLLDLKLNASQYQPQDIVQANLQVKLRDGTPVQNQMVTYRVETPDKLYEDGDVKTGQRGEARIRFRVPDGSQDSLLTLKIDVIGKKQSDSRTIRVPVKEETVALVFSPEGGALVNGLRSRVAFRACNRLQEPLSVDGVIVDNEGKVATEFKSSTNGIGEFILTPEAGKSYQARITRPVGVRQVIHLLPSASEGIVLSTERDDSLYTTLKVKPSQAYVGKKMYWVAEMRGQIYWAASMVVQDSGLFKLPDKMFPRGIVHLAVLDTTGAPIAERLFFANRQGRAKVSATPDKSEYGPSDDVTLAIQVKGENDSPVQAQLSLSFGFGIQSLGSSTPDIVTSFLIHDDVEGEFIDPEFRLRDAAGMEQTLDDLLAFHKPRRFDWRKVMASEKEAQAIPDKDFDKHVCELFALTQAQKLYDRIKLDQYKFSARWEDSAAIADAALIDEYFARAAEVTARGAEGELWKKFASVQNIYDLIRMIRPYQIYGNTIVFQASKSLFSPTGALIVIDGVKTGNDRTVLDGINVRDIVDLKVYVQPTDVQRFSSFAVDGVIEINTRRGPAKDVEQVSGIASPLWIPNIFIDKTGKKSLSFEHPGFAHPLVGILQSLTDFGEPCSEEISIPSRQQ